MQAYRLKKQGSLDHLTLQKEDIPRPGKGEVIVRIRAVSLNYRDLMIVNQEYPLGEFPPNGLIPCSDGAGEVVEVGEGVKTVKKGDYVYAMFSQFWMGGERQPEHFEGDLGGRMDGTLAQYRVFSEWGVIVYPSYLSPEEASCLPCAGVTAWHALFEDTKRAGPDSTVLTIGTGGVSIFALQFAHAAGSRVLITSSSDDKLKRAKEMGADDLINYKKKPQWDEEVKKATDEKGAHHVVELGGKGTFPLSVKSCAFGGRIHSIGVLSKEEGDKAFDAATLILFNNLRVRGVFTGSREMYQHMNQALEKHKIKPVIDKVFPFSQAKEAYSYMKSGAHFGKIVIKVE
jgi:NADPH:quinone reductase-like Zn-dependent oxidoreductase